MAEKSKKKILYVITKSVWGGAQKYVHDLAVALPKEYKAAVAGGGRGPMAEKIIAAGIPYFEIKAFQRDVNIFKDIWAFFEILAIFLKTKPDIVHVSSAKAGGIAGAAFFLYKKMRQLAADSRQLSAFFTAHGWTFNEVRPKWQIFLIKFFSKITCLFYDKIICVSEYDRQIALKNKIAPEKKLITIHNGINIGKIAFLDRKQAQQKLLNKTSPLVIGTIAEWIKNKNLFVLLEILKNIGEKIDIILIGSGQNPDKEKMYNFVKENNLNNVYLHEYIPDAVRYLGAFDIFILPSLKEGLPYALMEAGLAGLPSIASNIGGVPEIISNQKTGLLINPANHVEMSDAIKKLISNENLRRTIGQNAHRKILQEFSFKKMLQQTLAAYED